MQARFYDPAIGRFLQPDTIVPAPSNPQSLNRYSYVLNNPLRYVDPTGRCGVATNARLNNLLGLCGEGTQLSYGGWSVTRLPTFQLVPAGTSAQEYYCMVGSCGGWISGLTRTLTDIGLGTLPIVGEFCDILTGASGRTCSGQSAPRWTGLGVFLPFVGGRSFSKGDEGLDAVNAARRALSGADEAATARSINFRHGYLHLADEGLSLSGVSYVETSIAADIAERGVPASGFFKRTIAVGDLRIEYHGYVLPDGSVNVGTYFTVD